MLEQEYFTKEQIVEALQSATDYDTDSFDDLFNDMFNNDDYILGTYEAAQALETFKNDEKLDGYETTLDGIFGAIDLVKQYEMDQFGEVLPSLEDPEKIASMVEYIRGENLFNEVLNKAELDMDNATTEENIYKFIKAAKTL